MDDDLEIAWFGGDLMRGSPSVRVYKDGTIEIQFDTHSYRTKAETWISAAIELNCSVSHYRVDLVDKTLPKGKES